MTAELQFHELDCGCRIGVLKRADFHKVGVVVHQDYVDLLLVDSMVYQESCGYVLAVGGCLLDIQHLLHIWPLPLWLS